MNSIKISQESLDNFRNHQVFDDGDVLDMNGNGIYVGEQVLWHDPQEIARDLSRIYTVYRVSDEVILIADDYSEAEVPPSELEVIS